MLQAHRLRTKFFNVSSLFVLNFESTSSQDLRPTNSTNSSGAEEKEFYITGTEFLDKIQQYNKEQNFTEEELRYIDDNST